MSHHAYMQQALHLAAQGLGEVWPNPAVGCVMVQQGRVVGLGRTAQGGRPHAETQALAMAGSDARGATAYVTLEPCAHHGHTPPCAEALIAAGISEIYIATTDPDTRVNGRGIALLQAAGIIVHTGLCEAEAQWMNRGFFSRLQRQRPWVTLKIATTADGFIADAAGQSKWITNEFSRAQGHRVRSQNDAILTGIGTVLADDPALDCRLAGLMHCSPLRVVLDRHGRLPTTAKMLHDGGAEVLVLSEATIAEALEVLAARGITRLLVEAGCGINSAFLQAGLVDEVYWFVAPQKRFGSGLAAFEGVALPSEKRISTRTLGEDVLWHYIL